MTGPRAVPAEADIPVLSVIVAVHGDQAYLEGCVRSVLDSPRRDVEVVVVDNGGRDHVPDVLRELAEGDDRVVAVRLDDPADQGTARAAGLAAARGSYVWFVHPTDRVETQALGAVFDRLNRLTPDVLVVDYVAGGSLALQPSMQSPIVRRLASGQPTDAASRPELMELAAAPWGLLVSAALLDEWAISTSGQPSDVGFAYCVLLAARRIAAVPGVAHRRRRPLNAAHDPLIHGDDENLADSFSAVFAFLDAHAPALDDRRRLVPGRMVGLATTRLHRLPRSRRRPFAARLVNVVGRRSSADDVLPPGRLAAQRQRLVRRRAVNSYLALEFAVRSARALRAWAVTRSLAFRRLPDAVRLLEYRLLRLLPLQPDLAVFGAYWYRSYSCNPRAVYERMRELAPRMRGVWVTSPGVELPAGVETVVVGTRGYFKALARATYFVNNVGFPDHWHKRKGTVLVHTHHGTPLKRMGLDQYETGGPTQRPVPARHLARWSRWDFSLSSNELSTLVWERVYPARYTTLEYGYPRNDRLVTASPSEGRAVREALGIRPDAKVLLYAPTHREYERTPRQLLDPVRLAESLGEEWVVLNRAHYYYDTHQPISALAGGRVLDVTSYDSVEDLCLATDVLVTDYSSIMFDYAVLDRPIVIYAPDWEIYQLLRGTYFDVMAEAPGATCRTQEELAAVLTSGGYTSDVATKARQLFRRRFCEWEDGRAAERVVRRIFLGEHPELPAGRAA